MTDPFSDVEYLDRTTLERWDTCPFMAAAIERGDVEDGGAAADTGILAHDALAACVHEFIHSGTGTFEDMTPEDICFDGRPDIQQDAWQSIRPSLWAIKRFLQGQSLDRHGGPRSQNILRYQGGEGKRSGQLEASLGGGVVATSELDLLMAGETSVELEEVDWKTGRSPWTSTTIRHSFQFNFHSFLAFENYPDLELLHVRVWLTRFNQRTPRVTFTRKQAKQFEYRLVKINMIRQQVMDGTTPGAIPGEHCQYCPAVHLCPRALWPAKDINADAGKFAEDTMLVSQLLKQRVDAQKAYVKERGNIEITGGRIYGKKPPSTKATYDYMKEG